MRQDNLESSFEKYRRDRKFRRLQKSGPARPMGKNAAILQQLEDAEKSEIRDERLTREVHDFFSDATRAAADIVQRIAGSHEEESALKIRTDIEDFLTDVISRAETFMRALATSRGGGLEQDLEPKMHNLVGKQLDEFRHEGTAQLEDKHIGQDPFQAPAQPTPSIDVTDDTPDQIVEETSTRPTVAPAVGRDNVGESQSPWQPESLSPRGPMWEDIEGDDTVDIDDHEPMEPLVEDPMADAGNVDVEKMNQAIDLLVAGGVLDRDSATQLVQAMQHKR